MYKTYWTKPEEVQHDWYVVDAQGQTLGRLASRVASVLRGKHKPTYNPSVDCGDFVVIVNAEKVKVTGRRMEQKVYYRHSGYHGGLTETSLTKQLNTFPERVIESAVRGMLPKNRLGRRMFKKLKVYKGTEHPHQAQQPVPLAV